MDDHENNEFYEVVSDSLEKLAFLFSYPDPGRAPVLFEDAMTAEASFEGVFSGRLAVVITLPVLTELAANMLGIDMEDVGEEQCQDALKETVNIICGNWLPVKAGTEAVFNIFAPVILSPTEAQTTLIPEECVILAKLNIEEEYCDIYFFMDDM